MERQISWKDKEILKEIYHFFQYLFCIHLDFFVFFVFFLSSLSHFLIDVYGTPVHLKRESASDAQNHLWGLHRGVGEHLPRRHGHAAELLSKCTDTAAPHTHEVATQVAADTSLVAKIVAEPDASAWATAAHKWNAVGDHGTFVVLGPRKGAHVRQVAKAVPMEAAVQASRKVGGTAARSTFPQLVELTAFTSPVHLVQSKAALHTTGLDLVDILTH